MALVLCQRNAYIRAHRSTVLKCDASPSETSGQRLFNVILDDTILFPTGGGQPCDFGKVGNAQVRNVFRNADGLVVHQVASPVEEQSTVEVEVDWTRRFDHMQQHSAQHLASALAADHLEAPTVSWSLGEKASSIDLGKEGLGADVMERLEALVNARIRDALPVVAREVPAEELQTLPGLRTRGIPEGLRVARVVSIEGIDSNTCCGTHVQNTAELQAFKIIGTERKKGITRLTFVAGNRALELLGELVNRERALTKIMTCGGDALVELVGKLQENSKALLSENKSLLKELAAATGAVLAASSETSVYAHYEGAKMDFLLAVARSVQEKSRDKLILLTCGAEKGEAMFLLCGAESVVPALGKKVAEALKGKGGGRGGAFQGKTQNLAQSRAAALELLRSATL